MKANCWYDTLKLQLCIVSIQAKLHTHTHDYKQ